MAQPTATGARADLLGGLEQEGGVMIRRIRRMLVARAQAVQEELLEPLGLALASPQQKAEGPARDAAVG